MFVWTIKLVQAPCWLLVIFITDMCRGDAACMLMWHVPCIGIWHVSLLMWHVPWIVMWHVSLLMWRICVVMCRVTPCWLLVIFNQWACVVIWHVTCVCERWCGMWHVWCKVQMLMWHVSWCDMRPASCARNIVCCSSEEKGRRIKGRVYHNPWDSVLVEVFIQRQMI